jgi:hypothetical protein
MVASNPSDWLETYEIDALYARLLLFAAERIRPFGAVDPHKFVNDAIRDALKALNGQPGEELEGSAFEALDRRIREYIKLHPLWEFLERVDPLLSQMAELIYNSEETITATRLARVLDLPVSHVLELKAILETSVEKYVDQQQLIVSLVGKGAPND